MKSSAMAWTVGMVIRGILLGILLALALMAVSSSFVEPRVFRYETF